MHAYMVGWRFLCQSGRRVKTQEAGAEYACYVLFPVLNHINYRHTYPNNAIPSYRHAKFVLDLELTVAGEDVCGPNIPMNDHALVQDFYRRHDLSNALLAVEFLHQRMIIHRDIAPANILPRNGELQVESTLCMPMWWDDVIWCQSGRRVKTQGAGAEYACRAFSQC